LLSWINPGINWAIIPIDIYPTYPVSCNKNQQILLVATKTIENVLINHDMKKQARETDVNDEPKNKETYLQQSL
jgi:hypothetical protein